MKISVCITVFNEEKTISSLLTSLLGQSKKADEIVIVDGGSTDSTLDIIRLFQKGHKKINLLVKKCSRSEGRNLSVELAKGEIIAMTDAGCVPERKWLEIITNPFRVKEIDIVAGFYKMRARNSKQKAFSVFLGTSPRDFDINFLPSARSIAFRKSAWEKVGGFPESLKGTAEDTVFNYKALKLGLNFARVKNAKVEWAIPETFGEFFKKIFNYAKGDAMSGIWFHPSKGLMSHNVRAVSIFARFFLFLYLLGYSSFKHEVIPLFLLIFVIYTAHSFHKVLIRVGDWKAGLWGILVQLSCDCAVMAGFLEGVKETRFRRG